MSAKPKRDDERGDSVEVLTAILDHLETINARLEALETRTETTDEAAEATKMLVEALLSTEPIREQKVTPELYARLNGPVLNKVSGHAVARKGRIALAGKRSGFVTENNRPDVKAWLAFCEKHSWNPERKAPPELVAGPQVSLDLDGRKPKRSSSSKKKRKKKGGSST